MKGDYTFLDLAKEVLDIVKEPLNANEIWEKAIELGLDKKHGGSGKTPVSTIGARLYTDIKDNEKSEFTQVSKRPTKFYLKTLAPIDPSNILIIEAKKEKEKEKNSKFNERDLHPLVVTFLNGSPRFSCHSKTIFHEEAKKAQKGKNEWLFPDMVGVYFPFKSYDEKSLELFEKIGEVAYKLYSFELKKEISFTNLRECYFQAVSNSSWANEGYLVALKISKDDDFISEVQRLNNSFGIGLIELDIENIEQSEVIFYSKTKDFIDMEAFDRLLQDSDNFKNFIKSVLDDIKIKKVTNKDNYDKVLNDGEYDKYIKDKSISK